MVPLWGIYYYWTVIISTIYKALQLFVRKYINNDQNACLVWPVAKKAAHAVKKLCSIKIWFFSFGSVTDSPDTDSPFADMEVWEGEEDWVCCKICKCFSTLLGSRGLGHQFLGEGWELIEKPRKHPSLCSWIWMCQEGPWKFLELRH